MKAKQPLHMSICHIFHFQKLAHRTNMSWRVFSVVSHRKIERKVID